MPSRGFTLVEIMVVIFVLALMVGMISPRLDFNDDQYLRREAMHFRNVLQWATEQSLYEGKELVLQIDFGESTYQLLSVQQNLSEEGSLSKDNKAIPIRNSLVKQRKIKSNAGYLTWGLDQDAIAADEQHIAIGAWGPEEPIMLRFSNEDGDGGYQVIYTLMQFRPLVQPWST